MRARASAPRLALRAQAADEKIGEAIGDLLRARRAVRVEPARDPVHGAEQREREQLRIAGPNTPVAIPSSSTCRTPWSNVSRRTITAFRCAGVSASRSRNSAVPCSSSRIVWTNATIRRRSFSSGGRPLCSIVEQLHQPIERVLVAGEENLFLVLEVVVEVALLHVQRGGDLLDRRAVIAEPAERLRGAFQDLDARRRVRVGVARRASRAGAGRFKLCGRVGDVLTRSLPQL